MIESRPSEESRPSKSGVPAPAAVLHQVDAKRPATEREQQILTFWNEHDIFRRSQRQREGGPEFVFYDGPPTANGRPHAGHVITRVMKDVYPRYKAMKGYHTERKAGWDTHGLPVEIEIEKKFNISGKKQILAFGIERFVDECRKSVFVYESLWRDMSLRLAYWVDMDSPYMTLSDEYIESVWHLLRTIYDKGLLYQGHRVSPYCPHCETTLSSHEVAQGYMDVTDLSVTAKFRVTSDSPSTSPAVDTTAAVDAPATAQRPAYLLAWTTTPWTLPSNVALAVHPDLDYVCIDSPSRNEQYWVAADLADRFLHAGDAVVATRAGRNLVGMTYHPLLPYVTAPGKKFVVVPSGHVTAESGTGVVHMSPAHGDDDYRACREHNVVFVNFVDATGRFTANVPDFEARFVREEALNVDIVKRLAAAGLVYEKHRHEHSYPHCWRCDTPLLYYAIDSWFIRSTAVKDDMLANSNAVHWMPDHIREGRFGNFLENVVDWNLSRNRYWGTPLPIWTCAQCAEQVCVGSKAELQQLAGQLPAELHKPHIDDITWTCRCGGEMRRAPEVIDAWFDSGSMPFGQLHFPFDNQQSFARLFPADFICEAIDQTRGWFYSLLAIATIVTGRSPYRNVLVLGHVLDEFGKKMSKSKGNGIDPFEALNLHGGDALRFYFLSNTQPWNSQRFYHKAVAENKGKFIDLLQNVHAFYALYAGIDSFRPRSHQIPVAQRPLFDRWLLARLHDTIRRVDAWLNEYDATSAARCLQELVADLSTWYVRRNRSRFWAPGMGADKAAALLTLYETLTTLAQLIAPFTPFLAEDIWQNIARSADRDAPLSVHLCDFPRPDEALIDTALLQEMETVLRVVEVGRYLRNESKRKTRQPLSTLYVPVDQQPVLQRHAETLQDELNVKRVQYVQLPDIAQPTLYLNLKEVGQAYGKLLPALNAAAKAATPDVTEQFQRDGSIVLAGQLLSRDAGHAEVRWQASFPGLVQVTEHGFVGLQTDLTSELVEEGLVREVVSKMQMMRKEVNFQVTDRVNFWADGDAEVLDVLRRNELVVSSIVLIRQLEIGHSVPHPAADLTRTWDVNGKSLTLSVQR